MEKHLIKKGLVFAVIILFIGVSFQPIIADDIKPSDEILIESKSGNDDKVEYVVQIIRTNKVIEHKIYLTQQQADDLENLIDNIRSDLNNSESIEETTKIYNDAINSFDNLGLFPKNITVDEIKQLVFGETQNLNLIKFRRGQRNGFENSLCYVIGRTSDTFFISLFLNFASLIKGFLLIFVFRFNWIFNIRILSNGYLGYTWGEPNSKVIYYYPVDGWIYTNGINGVKNYSGSFYGNLYDISSGMGWVNYPGISGFTGICIHKKYPKGAFYIGFALKVSISTSV